ncbi:ABC transporter ATP-binding protein [Bacteroidota bacterium]
MKSQEKVLKINNLEIGYTLKKSTKNIVFKDINLTGNSSELIALVGRNGIGKSTLLRNIAGLQQPFQGEILYYDKLRKVYNRSEFAKIASFVSTEIVNISNLKVFDLVSLGRFPHTNWFGKLNSNDINRSNQALEMVGMSNFSQKNVNEISDGERQRVMIARTLAQDTNLIVLDEPTAFLDLPNKYEIVHLLNILSKKENKTVIFSTHDLNIAIQEADKIWLMLDNEIYEGAPEDLILKEQFNKIFEESNLKFDKQKGEFRMLRKHIGKIGLFADGEFYTWTKKALERMNFSVSRDDKSDKYIKVETGKKLIKWKLIENEKMNEFDSIYELSLYLKLQSKF